MDKIAENLIKLERKELIRKTKISATLKQNYLQDPIHNNYMFIGFFKEVLNGKIPLTARNGENSMKLSNFNSSEICMNFNDAEKRNLSF